MRMMKTSPRFHHNVAYFGGTFDTLKTAGK